MKRFRGIFALTIVLVLLLLSACTQDDSTVITRPSGNPTTPAQTQGAWQIVRGGLEFDDVRYAKGTVDYQVSVFKLGDKYGLVDFNGNIVAAPNYISIEVSETDYGSGVVMLRAYDSDYRDLYFEADGTVSDIVPNAWGYESTCHVYWKNGEVVEWGSGDGSATSYRDNWHPLYNLLGTIALTPSNIVAVQEMKGYTTNEWEETVVDVVSEKYALLDYDAKKLLTDFVYEDCSRIGFIEGILPVKKDGKWGYVNEKGEEITPFIYDVSEIGDDGRWDATRMYACTNGYIVVRQGDKWGLIDKNGNTVVEPTYDGISQVDNKGQFWIKNEGKWWIAQIS